MSNHIFPTDTAGRVHFTSALFFVGYIYLARVEWTGFFVGTLGTWLRAFFWLSPAIYLIFLIIHVIFVSVYTFKLHGHCAPGLFLIGGLLLVGFLPVPPTPEEISFSWQRAKYDQIVELARNNQLQQGSNCQAQNQYLPSSDYYQWSSECIHVKESNGLVVEFAPRSLERPILYLENPTSDKFPPCWSNNYFHVFKQLSEHWFICQRQVE